jgi:hypothetical protein
MGNRFRQQAGDAYARIVRDYPLSSYTEDAKKKLKALEMPIPQADPAAYARMKYEQQHRTKLTLKDRGLDVLRRGPDVHNAAKSGAPAMTSLRPTVPVSVPVMAEQNRGVNDVSVQTISGSSDLDKKPDARLSPPAAPAAGAQQSSTATEAQLTTAERMQNLPSNHTPSEKERKRLAKKYQAQQKQQQKKNAKKQPASAPKPAATPTPAATTTPPPSSSSNQ